MPKIKTNKWTPAGEALKLALKHKYYSADDELSHSTTYMCVVVEHMASNGDIPLNQSESYYDLWRAINTTYSFGLCDHLRSADVYDSNIGRNNYNNKNKVIRLKVGRIYWGAVAEYILSGARTIKNIDKVGCDAVRAAVAKGEI